MGGTKNGFWVLAGWRDLGIPLLKSSCRQASEILWVPFQATIIERVVILLWMEVLAFNLEKDVTSEKHNKVKSIKVRHACISSYLGFLTCKTGIGTRLTELMHEKCLVRAAVRNQTYDNG